MSFNRNIYDSCAYSTRLGESQNVLTYNLDPVKFYNCRECRIPFGVVGGNNVSRAPCNLVDIESELRNQVRIASSCPQYKYLPGKPLDITGTYVVPGAKVLPSCDLINYKPRVTTPGFELRFPKCNNPGFIGFQ